MIDAQTVGRWHSQRKLMEIDRLVTRAVRGGTTSMRAAGTSLTPMDFRERQQRDEYAARLARTVLFPAYDDAIGAIVDKPFQQPVKLEEGDSLPPDLQALEYDCDRECTPLTEMARRLLDAMADTGLAMLLVDKPSVTVQEGETVRVMRMDEEEAADIRPYFAFVHPDAVLSWSWRTQNGKRILSMISIFDESSEVDAQGHEQVVQTVRVWTEQDWSLWKRIPKLTMPQSVPMDPKASIDMTAKDAAISTAATETEPYALVDSGANPLGVVPVVFRNVSMKGSDPLVARPPLMDLAWKNVDDWLVTSSLSNNLHWHGTPMLVIAGATNDVADGSKPVVFGAGAMLASSDPQMSVQFVESSGAAAKQLAERLDQIRQDEQQLGLAPFMEQVAAGSTATAVEAAGSRTQSRVQSWVECLEWMLYDAYKMAARWSNEELPEDFDVDIYRDFGLPTRAQTDLQALAAARTAKDISQETYLRELQKRGVLGDEVDIEAEITETENEQPALGELTPFGMPPQPPPGRPGQPPQDSSADPEDTPPQ